MTALINQESETQRSLERQCRSIADDINDGILATDIDEYDIDWGYEDGDLMTGHHWLEDVMDYRYLLNNDGELLKVELLVAHGGPNIWVHIWHDGTGSVEGYWWGDRATANFYRDAMDVFECARLDYEARS